MQIQKLKLGQQNNDEGSINLAGANKKATLKCKKIIIKTLAKLYQSVYCHSTFSLIHLHFFFGHFFNLNDILPVIMWFLFGEVSSSSGCLGWATLFYCGTP